MAVIVLLFAGCGSGGGEVTVERKTPPAAMVEAANFVGVHSGLVEGTFAVENLATRGLFGVHVSAGFDRGGGGALPPFYVAFGGSGRRHGRPFEVNARLFYQPTQATFVYGPAFRELSYRPGTAEFKKLTTGLEAARGEGGPEDVTACIDAVGGATPGSLIRDPAPAGGLATPDGTRLLLVAGKIDAPALLDLMVRSAADPGCGAQMKALGLPSASELAATASAAKGPVGGGEVTVGVDRHGLVRYVKADLEFVNAQGNKVELSGEFTLREVNKPVPIEGSANARPLTQLLRKFDVNPQAVGRASDTELFLGLLEGLRGSLTGDLP